MAKKKTTTKKPKGDFVDSMVEEDSKETTKKAMAAPKGNQYWQKRKSHGKPKNIESPEKLWDYFCDYAGRIDDNPIEKTESKIGSQSSAKDAVTKDETKTIRLARPYTWEGFEDYLFEIGVIYDLGDYKSNKGGGYEDYSAIIKHISKIIYQNKFEGAAIGLFNANIIARDLGLKDETKTEHSGKVAVEPITGMIIEDATKNKTKS